MGERLNWGALDCQNIANELGYLTIAIDTKPLNLKVKAYYKFVEALRKLSEHAHYHFVVLRTDTNWKTNLDGLLLVRLP